MGPDRLMNVINASIADIALSLSTRHPIRSPQHHHKERFILTLQLSDLVMLTQLIAAEPEFKPVCLILAF